MASFSTETAIAVALALVIIYVLFRLSSRTRRFPPGPRGLPIVGYLPFLTRKPYIKLQELAKIYGPVFSLQMGSHYTIVLGDFKSMKEAFNSEAFIGRPPESPFDLNKETLQKGAINGRKWVEQRRFSIQMLKDLGFGKTRMEEHIKEEICDILERIESTKGEPTVLQKFLVPSVSNNISSLVFGRRMHHDDEKRIMLDGILRDIGSLAGQVGIMSFFPWLSKIMRFLRLGNFGKLDKANRAMKQYFWSEISEHERTLDSENIRDYIDAYLLQIEKCKSDPDTGFIKPVLQDLVGGFFGAGSETVRVTMDWITLTIAAFPDVQDKVHQEIDNVIGRERFPTWADHVKMPFTEAVMLEVMRWRSIVPINILRYTLEDSVLNNYDIPKHSYVVANIWAVQHDPVLWKEPDSFRPERFLSKDGKSVKKPEFYIPFSVGKRSCPGEPFALIEVFLYFTAILQKFDITFPEGAAPDFEGQLGISLLQKPQELILNLRQ